MKRYKPEGC